MSIEFVTASPDHWRNFLWALAAPDIAPDTALPWLPESRRSALARFFSQTGVRAELESRLLSHLQQLNNHRLGIYFEHLWAFAFAHHPDYQLLAHNFPIRDEARTLGELDFVVRHTPDHSVEHWEIALKFYLQVGDYWVGPGLKDRLDIKLQRMRTHQLPVARDSTATSRLRDAGITLDRQWALMPGRLFRPLDTASDDWSAPDHYWWADVATFREHPLSAHPSGDNGWYRLPKPCWLAPLSESVVTPPIEGEPLAEAMLARGPLCVARYDHRGERSRGFIVPADWAERAAARSRR
ncbi:DUF1853 family protein [Microbulbifer salipaludis]|uniref:DUF1853 family protein n=1 Tax=Microbulbifer salipaludis TaxID=187980 RepID=A0ABS3E4R5_9GAMM|nr:DUF1853 family protein [Microbulbifer salipaludis]MBN8430285.1 DUF1853 family protein [Microbulbifer salipaludis]